MKKKILIVAVAVILIAMMVSGTLAYFTAEDQVENIFTIGSVEIEIYENDAPTTETELMLGKLTPVVNAVPSQDVSYINKAVDVKNTGKNEAFIRVHIAQPSNLLGYLNANMDTTGWGERVFTTYATVDGQEYIVTTYDFQTAVDPGEFTTELLKGVYLAADVDLEADANGNLVFIRRDANGNKIASSGFVAHTKNPDGSYTSADVCVLVAAQAIQATGFDNGATAALNTGFGVNTNPWQ